MRSRCLRLSFLILIALASACTSRREPEISDATYRETVTAFYVGLSAMQTTQDLVAREKFDRVVELAPEEPAGWANLGLLLLRQNDVEQGAERLARAAELAPDSGAIQRLQALAEGRRGNLAQAIAHWRRALEIDPEDQRAAYSLALDTERQGGPENEAESQRLLSGLVARDGNLAARVELIRIAAKRGDQETLTSALAPLESISSRWSAQAQQQFKTLKESPAGDPRATARQVAFLKNVLLGEPTYRSALAELSTSHAEVGEPMVRFLRLKNPDPQPAPADDALTFAVEPVAGAPAGASWAGALSLDGEGDPVGAFAGPNGVRIAGKSTDLTCAGWNVATPAGAISAESVAPADLDYDFRMDLALAGQKGLCLLRQTDAHAFTDVTSSANLPPTLQRGALFGVWPADVDLDGDLDLVVAPADGAVVVLRNNGDGTFATRDPFAAVTRARGFAWADLDGEGVPDAAFLDQSGRVHVLLNLRGGGFLAQTLPELVAPAAAMALAEQNGDSLIDLLVLTGSGQIVRVSRDARDGSWKATDVSRIDLPPGLEPGVARLLTADLDNNGAADLIGAGPVTSRVLLGGPAAAYTPLPAAIPLGIHAVADVDGDGRLEALGFDAQGAPARAAIRGTKPYRWQTLRPRAATVFGDQRINSFGIGGEIEVRSGIHAQKRTITSPIVHFGLGDARSADVVRIAWPNGVLQAEYDTKADQTFTATQRLKGSCPWLFAWNGREMSFVTDLLWRSPLGLQINAQTTNDTLMTEDWVKIRGDQLQPREGAYDLRITAELWETHFFDLADLLVVDHPAGTEVFVDERFVAPQPKLEVVTTGPVRPFAAVRDDRGGVVSELAATLDSRFVDFAGRGDYQGITRRHTIEMDRPPDAPRTGRLWLVAQGWVHPTDSSINVAISQGAHAPPEGLSLHVADAAGRFREVRNGLGFPSGKDKTILIDLTDLFGADGPRRLQLATNLEVFWDRLGWAAGMPATDVHVRRLQPMNADLGYRGYSLVPPPMPGAPERPVYTLAGTAPMWRDLEGHHTRFGEVLELLASVDDRYVIMNAGDELRLRFPEAPPVASGLVRDFVIVTDGWVKDGDYNTRFSRTVLPLPTHLSGKYETPPRRLEDDPVYQRQADDFVKYHTRYVSSDPVRDALRTGSGHD